MHYFWRKPSCLLVRAELIEKTLFGALQGGIPSHCSPVNQGCYRDKGGYHAKADQLTREAIEKGGGIPGHSSPGNQEGYRERGEGWNTDDNIPVKQGV